MALTCLPLHQQRVCCNVNPPHLVLTLWQTHFRSHRHRAICFHSIALTLSKIGGSDCLPNVTLSVQFWNGRLQVLCRTGHSFPALPCTHLEVPVLLRLILTIDPYRLTKPCCFPGRAYSWKTHRQKVKQTKKPKRDGVGKAEKAEKTKKKPKSSSAVKMPLEQDRKAQLRALMKSKSGAK